MQKTFTVSFLGVNKQLKATKGYMGIDITHALRKAESDAMRHNILTPANILSVECGYNRIKIN